MKGMYNHSVERCKPCAQMYKCVQKGLEQLLWSLYQFQSWLNFRVNLVTSIDHKNLNVCLQDFLGILYSDVSCHRSSSSQLKTQRLLDQDQCEGGGGTYTYLFINVVVKSYLCNNFHCNVVVVRVSIIVST